MTRDYVAIASGYISDVLAGKIPACRYVKLACKRQLDDLARTDGLWIFDAEKAARVCRFIELLPHIKGRWGTRNIVLEPWQVFILTAVFGWVDSEGNRRYRRVYIEVPRKNGKSALSSGVALYCLCEDEPGSEIYSAATKKDQARIVFDSARVMTMRSPGLMRRFGLQAERHRLFCEDSAKEFKPLSSDEDGLDGLNIYCAIVDELHAHKSRAVWDVLDSATGSRRQSLIWAITTAGSNQQGVCYETREYVVDTLTGKHQDDRFFGVIYTIDLPSKDATGTVIPGDDWRLEATWRKANPNYGVSILREDIESMATKAMRSARSQNNFLTKRLDVWVTAEESYYNMEAWRACHRDVTLAEFERQPCWIGIDLASKSDIASKARIFKRIEKDRTREGLEIEQAHYYAFMEHYLPDSVLESTENANTQQFTEWSQDGHVRLTPGPAIDYEVIEDGLVEDCRRFKVQAIAYDPWNCQQLQERMVKRGRAPMVENPMGVRTMSEPMKESETLILAGRLHHDGDPAMAWMMGNVVAVLDNKDNVYPRKEKPERKIDGPVAMLMALGAALRMSPKESIYSKRGVLEI